MSSASVMIPRTRPRESGRRQYHILAGALIVVLAIGYLVVTNLQQTMVYYITVSELQAMAPSARQDAMVRVSGHVVPGTISHDTATNTLRFSVYDAGGQMPVVYRGVVPDIFADDVEVVVEGRYVNGTFEATTLLAKCPSRFEDGDKLMPPSGMNRG